MIYDLDRFHAGDMFGPYCGIEFRLRHGEKPSRINGHHDLVIEWRAPTGWQPVTLDPVLLVVDFIAWNEDALHPFPERGGAKVLTAVQQARREGFRRSIAQLHEERARANDAAAYSFALPPNDGSRA